MEFDTIEVHKYAGGISYNSLWRMKITLYSKKEDWNAFIEEQVDFNNKDELEAYPVHLKDFGLTPIQVAKATEQDRTELLNDAVRNVPHRIAINSALTKLCADEGNTLSIGNVAGKIEFQRKGVNSPVVAELQIDMAKDIANVFSQFNIFEIKSGDDKFVDMGYGYPLLHVNYGGKKFFHTPPTSCEVNPKNVPSKEEQAVFVGFCNNLLKACHKISMFIPTTIDQ